MKNKIIIPFLLFLVIAIVQAWEVKSTVLSEVYMSNHDIHRIERYELSNLDSSKDNFFKWFIDENLVGESDKITLIRNTQKPTKIELQVGENTKVLVPFPNFSRTYRPTNFDAKLNFFNPQIIYDDEEFEVYWELANNLIVNEEFFVKSQEFFADKSIDEIYKIPLAGRKLSERHSSGEYKKFLKSFLPDKIPKKWIVEASLGVSLIDNKKFRILKVDETLPSICYNKAGFVESDSGEELIFLLHRKSIAEQRTLVWDKLSKKVLLPTEKVLIIGENFGDFFEKLESKLAQKQIESTFFDYTKNNIQHSFWSKIPEILMIIADSKADVIVIMLSDNGYFSTIKSFDDWSKVLDLLIQKGWSMPNTKRVVLTTALPIYNTPNQTQLNAKVRGLLRGEMTELIEINHLLNQSIDLDADFKISEFEYSSYPIKNIDKIVDIFIRNL